jgi:threonine dehydratase
VATDTVDTFVDGVATRIPDPVAIERICAGAARIVAVPDEATREAMRVLHRCTHSAAEPAGAIALAGALAERSLLAGERVAVIQSGANADAALVASVLAG